PHPHRRSYIAEGPSAIAGELYNGVADLNAQVGWLTNGTMDLRFLLPAGLSALALRQLVVKGMALEEIPWYTLAWYAFDTFYKFNQTDSAGR
ncbi:MAG: DUF5132 domain-containing protein, partial [Chloroflexaceae bacterium]|nr:DUF5132 domain-containing protein [Chloroflexaceae bacterium]